MSSFCLKQTNAGPRPEMRASLGSFILFLRYFYLFCGLIKGAGTFPLECFLIFVATFPRYIVTAPAATEGFWKLRLHFEQVNKMHQQLRDQWVKENQQSQETRRWEKKPTAILFPTFQGFEMRSVNKYEQGADIGKVKLHCLTDMK